jgi:uroporphyrinogen decarboxylase
LQKNPLIEHCRNIYKKGKRLVAPLMGAPGVKIINSSIKIAQQNYSIHFKALESLADIFSPDIIFPLMDLSVEANALGRYTIFPKEDTAIVPKDKFDINEIKKLEEINISFDSRLLNYVKTAELMCISLPEKILKGAYVTGPYSLASLIMGSDEAAMSTILNPDDLHKLCDFATEKIQDYIRLLIAAGIDIICILEPTAVLLGPREFEIYSSSYVNYLINSCKYSGINFIYHVCGNTLHLIETIKKSGVQGISLDSKETGILLPDIAKNIPQDIVLIGNINSSHLMVKGTKDDIKKEVFDLLHNMDPYPNFILSTGCDLPQETPLENIETFFKIARKYNINFPHV